MKKSKESGNGALIVIMIIIIVILLLQKKKEKMSRGLKNNNPFNIRKSNENWLGKKKNSTDSDFEQFETLELGLRAGLKLLKNYVEKGYNTIEKIIERYSPAGDPGNALGSTENYIRFITNHSNISRDSVVNNVPRIAYFILCFENGKAITSEEELKRITEKYKL